jgi:hypothetical protein
MTPDRNHMRFALLCITCVLAACAGGGDETSSASAADSAASAAGPNTSSGGDTSAQGRDSAAATTGRLTAEGWGPLRIGMTRAQVVAAAGPDANPSAVGGPDPESCDQFRPRSAPQGLLVMVERDTLTRISLSRNAAVMTDAGFSVGDTAPAVQRHYARTADVTPHKYLSAPAKYITVWTRGRPPAPSARGIVYEIGSDDRVSHVHAGGPSIQYVEGCS